MHWNGEDERVYGTKIICFFCFSKQIILLSFLCVCVCVFFPSSVHYLPPWFLFFPSFLVVEVFFLVP
jgi:hypothetical protein